MTKRWAGIFLGLILLAVSFPQPAFAQSSEELKALRKEIEELKEGQKAIQKELGAIKGLLRARQAPRRAAPTNVVLSVDGAPFKGDKSAKLTLIDFSDYQ